MRAARRARSQGCLGDLGPQTLGPGLSIPYDRQGWRVAQRARWCSSAPDAGQDLPRRGETMAAPTFQKGDRVAFKESPEVVEGKVVGLWKGNFYRVAWESGLSYQGKTTIVSGNVIRKKAAPERAHGREVTEVAGASLGRPV